MSWFRIAAVNRDAKKKVARLDIYDQIGESVDWWTGEKSGIAARDFSSALGALGEIDEIDLHINSPGGSILDGWQIYNELQRHPATINVVIDGQAASMASVIAMAGDIVKMPENATFWVHNPMSTFSAWTTGYSEDMRKIAREALHLADDLDTTGEALLNAYVYRANGKLSADDMRALMDAETLITAERAVELGLADEIEQPLEMAASFDMATVVDDQKNRLGRYLSAVCQPPPRQSELFGPKVVVAQCAAAGFADLAPRLIAEDATEADVAAGLATARAIHDRCAAAGLSHRARALIDTALTKPIADVVGDALALRLEDLDPDIESHLPPGGRRPGGDATGIGFKRIWAARSRRAPA